MKKFFIPVIMVTILGTGFSYVQNVYSAGEPPVPSAPIKMDVTSKTVMFDHKDHKDLACVQCHHPVKRDGGQVSYKKCSSSGCHDSLARSQDPMSYYQIMHNKKPAEGYTTCMSCHTKIAGTDREKKRLLVSCIGSGCHPKK